MSKSKTKILITGGCGRIGSYFIKSFGDSYTVRIVDKVAWDSSRLGPFAGESLVADLKDPRVCRQACEGMDMVIHLAGVASPGADFMGALLDNNILASYHMFRAAKEAGCQRFIYASSVHAVSGYPEDVQVKSSMPVRPGDLYGVSKCFGEALGAYYAYSEGLPTIVLRIGGYTTPENYEQQPVIEPDDFLSADDFNDLLVKCLETPHITFAIAHAISNNRYKRLDLSDTRAALGYEPRVDGFKIYEEIIKAGF